MPRPSSRWVRMQNRRWVLKRDKRGRPIRNALGIPVYEDAGVDKKVRKVARRPKEHEPGEYLAKLLHDMGLSSFTELCKDGCDQDYLGNALVWLRASVGGKVEWVDQEGRKRSVSIAPFDSMDSALEGIRTEDAERFASDARWFLERVEKWKRTPFVRDLVLKGVIPPGDFLTMPWIDGVGIQRFYGVLHLPEWIKQLHTRDRPKFSDLLKGICLHVRERTGKWNDRRLACILADLFTGKEEEEEGVSFPSTPTTPKQLEQWRHRHGLKN